MIVVEYQMLDDGKHELRVTGHAMGPLSECGDLVCAGASMLIYTLAARLQVMEIDGYCTDLSVRMDSGDAVISASPSSRCSCHLGEAYKTVLQGYKTLEKQYPECVTCDFH